MIIFKENEALLYEVNDGTNVIKFQRLTKGITIFDY